MASLAEWVPNVTMFLLSACMAAFFWNLGKVMAHEMSEQNRILRGFLEKPDDADFARRFRNFFNKRSFGFRTGIYYVYQYDDERFYRNFRKQHYNAYRFLPAILMLATIAYMGAFGFMALYSLLGSGHSNVSLMDTVFYAAFNLVFVLWPLAFIPAWKEVLHKLRLLDELDRRFCRCSGSAPD